MLILVGEITRLKSESVGRKSFLVFRRAPRQQVNFFFMLETLFINFEYFSK